MEKAARVIQLSRKQKIFKRSVQFTKLEENEEVLVDARIKNGHFKVQIVRLASDKGWTKYGIKCINLDKPDTK